MNWLSTGFYYALAMLWETLWALVLGFGISAALQVLVSKERINRALGRAGLREVALAMGLGAASSSCSYAAVAAARSAFIQGAALVPTLAFMFASTNLVIELGFVLWILMGWRFVLAEVVGSFVLVGVMWMLVRAFVPKDVEAEARAHAQRAMEKSRSCHDHHHSHVEARDGKLVRLASAFVMDWQMIWKEIAAGFIIGGFLAALVPADWWRALFLEHGPGPLRMIENAIVGPLIAMASFVCSVGNIPLASLLWSNGISFGGVISFIYADLIVIPLILIYRKYYGDRAATYITLVLFSSIVIAGIIVDAVLTLIGVAPAGPRPAPAMAHAMITWNYTTWLDLIALLVAAILFWLNFRQRSGAITNSLHG